MHNPTSIDSAPAIPGAGVQDKKYKTEQHVCGTGQLIRIEEIATN